MQIQSRLKAKLQTTRIKNQFPLSVFVFIDSLVLSALGFTRRGWPCSKITSSCIGLPFVLVELFYIGIPVVRTGGRSRDYQKFRGWVDYNKTLPSRSQGLDFLIYVSEEERKKLETTLKVTYLSFHCTGPHIPPDLFLYTHTHSFTLFSLYSRKWLLYKVPFRSFSLILLHVLPSRD